MSPTHKCAQMLGLVAQKNICRESNQSTVLINDRPSSEYSIAKRCRQMICADVPIALLEGQCSRPDFSVSDTSARTSGKHRHHLLRSCTHRLGRDSCSMHAATGIDRSRRPNLQLDQTQCDSVVGRYTTRQKTGCSHRATDTKMLSLCTQLGGLWWHRKLFWPSRFCKALDMVRNCPSLQKEFNAQGFLWSRFAPMRSFPTRRKAAAHLLENSSLRLRCPRYA